MLNRIIAILLIALPVMAQDRLPIWLQDGKQIGMWKYVAPSTTTSNVDFTPIMFSNSTTTNYVVSASSEFSSDYYAWYAFNGDITTEATVGKWTTAGDVGGVAWLKIDLQTGNAKAANKYYMMPDWTTSQTPKTWTFEGSDNDSTWTVLDGRTNITWSSGVAQTFTFSNSTTFRYYRLNISATGGGTYVGLVEWRIIGSVQVPQTFGSGIIPTMTANNAPANYVASADGEYTPPTYAAFKAFDGDANTFWFVASGKPHWLQIDLGSGNSKTVRRYSIQQHQPTYTPLSYALLGSTDGSTWHTLDAQIGTPTWNVDEIRYYAIPNQTSFRYYRLWMNDVRGGNYAEVGEFQIYE